MTTEQSTPMAQPEDTQAPAPTPPLTQAQRKQAALPVLEQLFQLYPHLFGARFRPLKRGIFQDLLARHPDLFDADSLKNALGVHTRSSPYLQCLTAEEARHDLDGQAVEALAPEHVHQALMALFHRRQARSKEDLRPQLRRQLIRAFKASGLTPQEYLSCVQTKDAQAMALLEEALAEHAHVQARQDALHSAYLSSGKTVEEFAAMYGLPAPELKVLRAKTAALQATASSQR